MLSAFNHYFESLRGKKIAVLGLGVSNRPLVQLLLQFGCDVTGCDRTPGKTWRMKFWSWKRPAVS